MHRRFLFAFVALMFFSATQIFSQNDKKDVVLEDLVEEIAANSDEELDYSTIYDDLQYFLDNPLNLNEATVGQLNKLHFLNQIQIDGILNYRKKYGDFQTIYELQLIEGFDAEDVERLLPFVTIEHVKTDYTLNYDKILEWGRHEVFFRTQTYLQPMAGYNIPDSVIADNPDKARYLGNPLKYYIRYKFHYRDRVQWGITAEKDPGEQFFAGAQKYGFDYYSAHLQIDEIWKFKRVLIGDYQAQFGQGLALWTGLTMGKSSYVLNVKKKSRGIRKYASTDENQFMRGAGVVMEFNNFTFTTFGSYHKIDANISTFDSLDMTDIREISSIQNTGYHRTPSEIEDRHAIGETIFGANISYQDSLIKTGLTFVDYSFSADLLRDPKPYQIYEFQGHNNFNLGWDYEFELMKFHFFGETAISQSGGLATVNGVFIPLEHRISLVTLYRNYSPKYQAYFSGAFAEGSHNENEKGLYFGLEIYPYPKFKISSYLDTYTFPWLNYRINTPLANGLEYFTQIDYNPSRNVSMYLRYKHEIKPQNISDDAFIKYPVDTKKWDLRYHISFQVSHNLTLRNRVEFTGYQKDTTIESGFMAYQDIRYQSQKYPLTAYFRYAVFDAPYDARIYAYENDILYAFSVPGYFYRGFRMYLVGKYEINRHLTVWAKYSQYTFTDRDVISEGSLNEIDGNTKSEIKLQLRYKF